MSEFKLKNDLNTLAGLKMLPSEIDGTIIENLNPKFRLRPYQKEAFQRFQFYLESYPEKKSPAHLLYQMATGSGKTLIMAGCILHLYKKGYRNFLFFVNSTNIIEKTRDNFLNKASVKYLFNTPIQIDGEIIRVNEVDNFQGANNRDINIHFTTIQGLHSRMNNPKENAVTYEDFENQNVVMLSDEAHHMNVDTKKASNKKLNVTQQELFSSWESTVMRIFDASKENLLLEFTATAELDDPFIAEKYKDKLIFDYSLKQFYLDKYSKEVNVLQADLEPVKRALQAIILSQYRLLVFAHHQQLIKPVVMFKSNYVNRGKTTGDKDVVSSEFKEAFLKKLSSLSESDLLEIKNQATSGVLKDAFTFFEEKEISLENLALQLKEAFSDNKCISIDSGSEDTSEARLRVNTLEDPNNQIRAVFAVEALNEGWDVLNLFDIVRLYEGRDAKGNRPGKKTIREAQLIGRGARYCPFKISEDQPLYQRKFDEDLTHPLRVCEELYYHSKTDSRYIQELNIALDEVGIKPNTTKKRELKLKDEFKASRFYKHGIIYLNEQEENKNEEVLGFPKHIYGKKFHFEVATGRSSEQTLLTNKPQEDGFEYKSETEKPFFILGKNTIRKALQRRSFYKFSNLKRRFPHLKSISEFIESDSYLGNIKILIKTTGSDLEKLAPKTKLSWAEQVLKDLEKEIEKGFVEKKGTKIFKSSWIKEVFKDKELNFNLVHGGLEERGFPMSDPAKPENRLDLSKESWYAFEENYGTDEEKKLVKFIKDSIEKLQQKYDEVHLLRNEKHFKLYNFSDDRALEPDFLLHLSRKEGKEEFIYQVFIEPKGDQLLENDSWKEDFLKELASDYKLK
jgi:type III restriction enzyme